MKIRTLISLLSAIVLVVVCVGLLTWFRDLNDSSTGEETRAAADLQNDEDEPRIPARRPEAPGGVSATPPSGANERSGDRKDDSEARSLAEVASIVGEHFDQLVAGLPLSGDIDQYVRSQPGTLIAALRPYVDDRVPAVRRRAITLLAHAAHWSESPSDRGWVADLLVGSLPDEDPWVRSVAIRDVYQLEPPDFSSAAKAELASLLTRQRPTFDVVKLVGYARVDAQEARLEQLALAEVPAGLEEGPRYFRTERWAALLALARLGDTSAMSEVVQEVQTEPDAILRVTRLLDDLGFTQRRQAYELLRLYLESDDKLPPVKEGGAQILYAQHAIDVLARWMPEFPVERHPYPGAYSLEEIERARRWLADDTNLASRDSTTEGKRG